MKRLLISLVVLLIFACSCGRNWCNKFYPPSVAKSDTITVTTCEYVHDTIFKTSADSSTIRELLECDKNGQITLKELLDSKAGTSIAKVPAFTIKANMLSIDCKCDSAKIHAILKDRETRITEKSSVTITPPVVQVKYIPGWMWFFGITGMIALGASILFGVFLILKSKI
jgi:hypothetical protein